MVWLILGCEIAFWYLILVGLSVRYLAGHRSRAGARRRSTGDRPGVAHYQCSQCTAGDPLGLGHALAPIYIGFSVACEKVRIRGADFRFAHLVSGGAARFAPIGAHTR